MARVEENASVEFSTLTNTRLLQYEYLSFLPNWFCEDSRRLNDSSVFGKDLVGYAISHFLDLKHVLLCRISGDLEFAGYSSVGFIKIVEINDSAYICHQFHPNARLSKCLEMKGFSS